MVETVKHNHYFVNSKTTKKTHVLVQQIIGRNRNTIA